MNTPRVIKFERALSDVRTLLDVDTTEEVERLKSKSLELAKTTRLSPHAALRLLADQLIVERLIGCR